MIEQDETEVFILIDGNENEYMHVGTIEEFNAYKDKLKYYCDPEALKYYDNDVYLRRFYNYQKNKNKIIIKQIKMNLEC